MAGARRKVSAGLLMYRRGEGGALEVFLAHPGGPFWAARDEGAWTIPKGEVEEGAELLATAVREFAEETGIEPSPPYLPLGSVSQRGGKVVHAWAFAGEHAGGPIRSNTFRLEWPPGSGKTAEFPEIDRAEFFDLETAKKKLNPAQAELVDRLAERLARE